MLSLLRIRGFGRMIGSIWPLIFSDKNMYSLFNSGPYKKRKSVIKKILKIREERKRLALQAYLCEIIFSFCVAKRPERSERTGSGLYHIGLFLRQSSCGSPSLWSHMHLSENRKGNQEPQKLFFSFCSMVFHASPNKLFV